MLHWDFVINGMVSCVLAFIVFWCFVMCVRGYDVCVVFVVCVCVCYCCGFNLCVLLCVWVVCVSGCCVLLLFV
jgi:hypothetical protein